MKPITVIPDGLNLKQRREAYLWAEKHQRDFPNVKQHTWEGSTCNYTVINNKTIRVRLAK